MSIFDGISDETQGSIGNVLGALGAGLLSGDRYHPVGPGFNRYLEGVQKGTPRAALKALLIQAGASPEQAEQYSVNEGVAKLALQNIENGKTDALIGGAFGGGNAAPVTNFGMGAPKLSPTAPPGPAAGASLNGGTAEQSFLNTLIGKESGGNPNAKNPSSTATGLTQFTEGTWGDMMRLHPELGLTPGGRTDPEQAKKAALAYAQDNGKLLAENGHEVTPGNLYLGHFLGGPGSTRFLNGLRTNPNAPAASYADPAAVAANKSVFFGRDGQPKTAADFYRERTSKFGAASATPTQVADASGQIGAPGNPEADMPAENAAPATLSKPVFDIPSGQPSETATTRTQVAMRDHTRNKLQAEVQSDLQKIALLGTRGDRAKGAIEALKLKVQAAQKYLEPTDAQKILQAAGISPDDPQGQKLLLGAVPGNADTSLQKEYGTYRQQEISEGRVPLSQIDYDTKLRTAGKTDINIRNDAEKKEEVGRAESVTKFLGGIADSAPATAKRAASLDQLGRLISRTATAQGTTLKAQLDGIGKELGLSTGELKTKADAINAIVNSLAPQMREPGTGTVSDADLRGFLAALPSLSATPEGNQLILGGLKRATDVDRERTKIAAQWQAGKLTAAEARSKIAEIDERSIYASDAERSLVMGLSPIPENKARAGWRVLGVE